MTQLHYKARVLWATIITGSGGFIAQMLLLRELLIVFSGNELSIGIILANWLIIEAFGSFFIGKKAENTRNIVAIYAIITVLFSVFLPVSIYFTRILKNILGIAPGQMVGIIPVFWSSFLIILPSGMLHGALFTFGCKILSRCDTDDCRQTRSSNARSIGQVYVYETAGTIIGGLAWTYLLIPFLHSFYIALGLGVLNSALCLLLLLPLWKNGASINRAMTISSLMLMIALIFMLATGRAGHIHKGSISNQWRAQNVVHYQNSVYGNICVIENQGQYTFFLDGMAHIITPVPDIEYVEEFVHIPLLSHRDPKEILVLSGGAGGVISEILAYPHIQSVDYTELDPLLPELIRRFPTEITEEEFTDHRVKVHHVDGRLFLKTTANRYDLIMIGLTEPSDLQSNRFFTMEFYKLARKRLNNDGILVTTMPGSMYFDTREMKRLTSSIYRTMLQVFPAVRVLPGFDNNLVIASKCSNIMDADAFVIGQRLIEHGLAQTPELPRHIEYKLHPGWADWLIEYTASHTGRINRDFRPAAMYYNVSHWNVIFTPFLADVFDALDRVNILLLLPFFLFPAMLIVLFKQLRRNKTLNSGRSDGRSLSRDGAGGLSHDDASGLSHDGCPADGAVATTSNVSDGGDDGAGGLPCASARGLSHDDAGGLPCASAPAMLLCVITTGFAGMILDLIMIFTFQAIYGYVFAWLGLLVSFFMAGTVAGALKMNALLPKLTNDIQALKKTELAIMAYPLLLLMLFPILQPLFDNPDALKGIRLLFLLLSFVAGLITGSQFPLLNRMYLGTSTDLSRTAGLLYGFDLLGGWFGGILGSVILLPILGLNGTCIMVALVKLCSFVVLI